MIDLETIMSFMSAKVGNSDLTVGMLMALLVLAAIIIKKSNG